MDLNHITKLKNWDYQIKIFSKLHCLFCFLDMFHCLFSIADVHYEYDSIGRHFNGQKYCALSLWVLNVINSNSNNKIVI